MLISELEQLLTVLQKHGVTYYKTAELELNLNQADEPEERVPAIGFAATERTAEELETEARVARLKTAMPAAYFDPRLGLMK